MDRLQLNQTQQSFVDDYRQAYSVGPATVVLEGTNLVVDDHLQVDESWLCVVLGPSVASPGCFDAYMPDWGEFYLPLWDIPPLVTDRAGPNGETMPIYDEQPMQALAGPDTDPKRAARAERREERAHRRDRKELLRDALRRLPGSQRKQARKAMREKGLLGHDDKDDNE